MNIFYGLVNYNCPMVMVLFHDQQNISYIISHYILTTKKSFLLNIHHKRVYIVLILLQEEHNLEFLNIMTSFYHLQPLIYQNL